MKQAKRIAAVLLAAVMLLGEFLTPKNVKADITSDFEWVGKKLEISCHEYYDALDTSTNQWTKIQGEAMPQAGKTPSYYTFVLKAPETPDLISSMTLNTPLWYDCGPASDQYDEPVLISEDTELEGNHYYEVKIGFRLNKTGVKWRYSQAAAGELHTYTFSPTTYDDGHGQTNEYLYSFNMYSVDSYTAMFKLRFRCQGSRIYSEGAENGSLLMIETTEDHMYPLAGTKPFYDFTLDTNYYPGEASSIQFKEVFWYPESLSSKTITEKREGKLSETATFKKGEKYILYMDVEAYNTHAVKATFGSDVAVEGFASHWIFYEMPTITYKNERNVVLEYPFEITDQLIDSVKITGLTAPVAGKQPQTSGFKASDSSLNLEIDWSDSSNKFATDGSFIGGNTYKALISVYADTSTNDIVELDTSKISVNTGKVSAGPYPDTFYVTFTAKKLMSNATVTVADQAWTGSALTPAPTVKYGSTTLKKDTDYTVSYKNNTNLGTATVTITGKGNYTGTKTATFKITQRSITPTITLTSTAYTYDGKGKTPGVTVKDGTKTLVRDTDYTITWPSGRTNVGTYTIKVTLKGNYKGSASTTFKINPKSVTPTITLTSTAYTYDGKGKTPGVTVKDGSTTLKRDTDYTITWPSGRTNAGTYTIKVTLKGNYKGSASTTFKINPKSVTPTITLTSTAYTYDGKGKTPGVTVKAGSTTLKRDTDYTITWPSGRTNAGTYTIKVTLKGNYKGSAETTFKIKAKSLEKGTITLEKSAYTYTGSAIKPGATVVVGGKTLVKNTDYTVAYKKNTDVGKAVVVITGKGNYKGTAKATFKIKQAAQPLEVTKTTKSVKYTKVKKETQKVKGAITVTGAVGTVQYKRVSGDDCLTIVKSSGVIKVKKGTPKGTYKIKVKVVALATDNYKKTAKTVTVTIKVK